MAGPGDLYACAQEFLAAVLDALDTTDEGAPACYFISPGPPIYDFVPCLTVHIGGPALADTFPLQPSMATGHRITQAGEVNLINMTATILRCAPEISDENPLPSPDAENAASAIMYADLWAIWMNLKQMKATDALFPPKQREFELMPAVAINQQGGACGWQIPIRVNLYGYSPTVAS